LRTQLRSFPVQLLGESVAQRRSQHASVDILAGRPDLDTRATKPTRRKLVDECLEVDTTEKSLLPLPVGSK
jgi:hypothetical protein